MRAAGTILCALPPACFEERQSNHLPLLLMHRFIRDLSTIERRLPKDVAADDERFRYARLCRQIEEVALANAVFDPSAGQFGRAVKQGAFPALRIGSDYVDMLREVHLRFPVTGPHHEGRLGASVFSPREIKAHLAVFERAAKQLGFTHHPAIKHRVWFLRSRVLSGRCGLVEVPDPLSAPIDSDLEIHPDAVDARSIWKKLLARFVTEPVPAVPAERRRDEVETGMVFPPSSTDWEQYGRVDNRGDFMETRLRSQIETALAHGTPVNLTNQRHNMVTRILQEYIHSGKQPASYAPLAYNEGEEVAPFPLRCLPRLPSSWEPSRIFHVALVSMRHLEIDQYTDVTWFRNVEVPSASGLAGADAYCFETSVAKLKSLLDASKGQNVQMHIYHAGYVPAVIGFYRAVVTLLASGQYPAGVLQVVPQLQPNKSGNGFTKGLPWPEVGR